MNKKYVGDGEVVLVASPERVYTDIAARFVRSERDLEDIISTPYTKKIVRNIIESGHEAATEFDFYIFGVQGYARVTEVQLVRKRLASYMIKTGRADMEGKRSFNVVIPEDIESFYLPYKVSTEELYTEDGDSLWSVLPDSVNIDKLYFNITAGNLLNMIEGWYDKGVKLGLKEEELRYLKPQGTEFRALIGMNAHALRDWFRIRCCKNAQTEIRDMANKMLKLCKEDKPDLFSDAGANCKRLGYCPENSMQHEDCKGRIITKEKALKVLKLYRGLQDGSTILQERDFDGGDTKNTEESLDCISCVNKESELYPLCDNVNENGDCVNFERLGNKEEGNKEV